MWSVIFLHVDFKLTLHGMFLTLQKSVYSILQTYLNTCTLSMSAPQSSPESHLMGLLPYHFRSTLKGKNFLLLEWIALGYRKAHRESKRNAN